MSFFYDRICFVKILYYKAFYGRSKLYSNLIVINFFIKLGEEVN